MANNENTASKTAEKVKDNRVEVFVPKGYANDEPNLFIGVNGVNYLLPKGKKSVAAQEKRNQTVEQMLEASK